MTQEQRRERYLKSQEVKNKELKQSIIEKKRLDQDVSNFVWYLYKECQEQFPDMKQPYLPRLMYAATFLTYEGCLADERHRKMTKADLERKLNLSRNAFASFFNDMVSRSIFQIKNGYVYINTNIFFKGNLTTKRLKTISDTGNHAARMYVDTIRYLYEHATPASHKKLGYVFQLVPFINYKYNILCYNPCETNQKMIQHMTVEDFAAEIGFDIHHVNNLYRSLFDPKFVIDGVEYKAVVGIDCGEHIFGKYRIVMNPRLYYAGQDPEDVKALDLLNENNEVI